MKSPLTIGRLAKHAGVNIETIRYYQRIGIIKEPVKPLNGYRIYSTDITKKILFIKRAQKLGFSLKEIADLLSLGDGRCADVMQRAKQKREHISSQINDLIKLQHTLDTLISACLKDKDSAHCPIVEALTS